MKMTSGIMDPFVKFSLLQQLEMILLIEYYYNIMCSLFSITKNNE